MPNLSSKLARIPDVHGSAPWPDHEYVKGWGVFGLPFDSGHVLALRVFPESSFGPYRTLWHRDPDGRWSIYVDGPRLDTACPRYYGKACSRTGFAHVDLTWTGPATLRVVVDSPSLTWTLTAVTTPILSVVNAFSAGMPLATWRPRSLIQLRESMARALGLGHVEMSGTTPSGHHGIMMARRMYYINDSHASLDGVDLGRPVRLPDNPALGEATLPARGVLSMGLAMWRIKDHAEYERARRETAPGYVPTLS